MFKSESTKSQPQSSSKSEHKSSPELRPKRFRYLFLIILLVWASISLTARYLLNDISSYSHHIESFVESKTDSKLEIGQLSGRWLFFSPLIELKQSTLVPKKLSDVTSNVKSDLAGEENLQKKSLPTIHAEHIALEVDLIESVFTLSPKFKRLLIDGIVVNINNEPLVDNDNMQDSSVLIEKIEALLDEYIFSADNIYLSDIEINAANDFQKKIVIKSLVLSNDLFNRNMSFDIAIKDVEDKKYSIKSHVNFQGNPLNINNFSAKVFLDIEKNDFSYWAKRVNIPNVSLSNVTLAAKVWFEISEGVVNTVSLQLDSEKIAFAKDDIDEILSLKFIAQWQGIIDVSQIQQESYRANIINTPASLKFSEFSIAWKDLQLQDLSFIADQAVVSKLESPLQRQWSEFEKVAYVASDINQQWLKEETARAHDSQAVIMRRLAFKLLPFSVVNKITPYVPALNDFDDFLQKAKPEGLAEQIQLLSYQKYRNEEQEAKNQPELYASLYVKDLGISAARKIPGIHGVDAYFELAPNGLGIELNTQDALLEKSDYLFRKDVAINSAKGSIFLDKLPGDIVIHSDLIAMQNSWAKIHTTLALNIPDRFYSEIDKEPPAWSLIINFDPAPLLNGLPLFPATLPPSLLDWLDGFLLDGNVGGDLMLFSFAKKYQDKTFTIIDADLDVKNAHLDYLPRQWPSMHDVKAKINVHNDQIKAKVSSAKMFNSTISNAQFLIPSFLPHKLPRIKITGDVSGKLEDVKKLFLESELKEDFSSVVEDWSLQGSHFSKFEMDFPLSEDSRHYESKFLIDASIPKASLFIESIDLGVNEVKTDIRYSFKSGLQTESLVGKFFNYPFQGSINTVNTLDSSTIQIHANTEFDSQNLRDWQSFWLFDNFEGKSLVDTTISIGELNAINDLSPIIGLSASEDSSNILSAETLVSSSETGLGASPSSSESLVRVDIKSNLEGISIDLPGQYKKEKNTKALANFQLDIVGDETVYRVAYAGLTNDLVDSHKSIGVAARLNGDNFEQARVNFGSGVFPLPTEKGLIITGEILQLNFEEWLAYVERNLIDETDEGLALPGEQGLDTQANVTQVSDPAAILNRIDVTIGSFFGFDQQTPDLNTFITRKDFSWHIEVESDTLSGVFIVPDEEDINRDNPIIAKLKYLNIDLGQAAALDAVLNSAKNSAELKNAASTIDSEVSPIEEGLKPEDFVFISMDIEKVILEKKQHGRWQFDFLPQKNRVDFNIHQLNYGVMVINGKGYWDYQESKSQSYFDGRLRTGAATRLYSALSLQPSANSGGLMAIKLRWPGSPLDFDPDKMKGTAGLEIFDGSIVEVDINSKKFKALGIFNLGILTDILTLRIFKKIGKKIESAFSENANDDSIKE